MNMCSRSQKMEEGRKWKREKYNEKESDISSPSLLSQSSSPSDKRGEKERKKVAIMMDIYIWNKITSHSFRFAVLSLFLLLSLSLLLFLVRKLRKNTGGGREKERMSEREWREEIVHVRTSCYFKNQNPPLLLHTNHSVYYISLPSLLSLTLFFLPPSFV